MGANDDLSAPTIGEALRGIGRIERQLERQCEDDHERWAAHTEAHEALVAEVRDLQDWRRERAVFEGIAKWLIGSNVAVLIGLVLAVLAFVERP